MTDVISLAIDNNAIRGNVINNVPPVATQRRWYVSMTLMRQRVADFDRLKAFDQEIVRNHEALLTARDRDEERRLAAAIVARVEDRYPSEPV